MLRVISWPEEAEKRREWSILLHRWRMDSFTMAFFLSYSLFAMCTLCSGELLDFVWCRW